MVLVAALPVHAAHASSPEQNLPRPTVPPVLSSPTAGDSHTCMIREQTVWCSGLNSSGQLGTGTRTRTIAFSPSRMTQATSTDAGGATSCAVRVDATLWCWGLLPTAQATPEPTAPPTMTASLVPVQIPLLGVKSAAVGGSHVCALLLDGTVWCWGSNSSGQLGNDSVVSSAAPVMARIDSVESIDAGRFHSCAVKTDSTVWCWGSNLYHRLGQRRGSLRTTPAPVAGVKARAVATGEGFTCAISTARAVQCWGRNNYGQIGRTAGKSRITPHTTAIRGARTLSAGTEFVCATTARSTWCWGRNRLGQLADGTNKYRSSPRLIAPVADLGSLTAVAAGSSHACALGASGGSMWCWGDGTQGQLGDGSALVRRRGVAVWPNGVQMRPIGTFERATIVAAGDIACDTARRIAYGDGPGGLQCGDLFTATLAEMINPDAVLALGDLQYENADFDSFDTNYRWSWGRLASKTYPIRGNHEYLTPGAGGYVSYFGAMSPSYWWTDAGGWRLIAVDSWCQGQLFAGCADTSAQTTWLATQLARARAEGKCVAVVMHHPIVSSGRLGTSTVAPLWQTMVNGGADLVLAAHEHFYERFEPLGTDALPAKDGVPLFINGLGGAIAQGFITAAPGSAVRINEVHGLLKVTFSPSSYEWSFVSVLDGSSLDAGTAPCSA